MKRLSGIYQNCDPVDQPEGFYRHAKNIVLAESKGAVTNEQGTILKDSIPVGNEVIGTQLLSDESTIIFSVSKTDENSEIGIFSNDSYTTLINSNELAFSISNPIQSDTTVNNFDEQIVVWTDGINQPRWLNIDNPTSDVNYTSLFPYTEDHPFITIDSINYDEGSLEDGVYYFAIAYMDNDSDDVISDFYNVVGPVNVRPPWENTGSSSITFSIEQRDSNYENIQIAVIKKIDNVIDQVDLLPEIGNGVTSYTYSGNESVRPGSLAEIQIDNAYYPTTQTLHFNDDTLYMGHLEEGKDIGYQKYANIIKTHLVEDTPENAGLPNGVSSQNQLNNIYYKGYFKGETYAFYISWLLKEGGESKAYHIPGRASTPDDITAIEDVGVKATCDTTVTRTPTVNTSASFAFDGNTTTVNYTAGDSIATVISKTVTDINADVTANMTASAQGDGIVFKDKLARESSNLLDVTITFTKADWDTPTDPELLAIEGGDIDPFFPAINTMANGQDPGTQTEVINKFQNESTKDPVYGMGYWENQNEVYPSSDEWNSVSLGGEDLRGQPVRHHSIPDVKNLGGAYKYTFPVGFRLTNVTIPEELEGKVSGYKVYYAEHTNENKKILDQGLLINSAVDLGNPFKDDNDQILVSSPYNGFSSGTIAQTSSVKYAHPFTLLRKKLNISGLSSIQVIDETQTVTTGGAKLSIPWENGAHDHYVSIVTHTLNTTRQYSGSDNIDVVSKAYVNSSNIRNNIDLEKYGFSLNMNNYSGESKLVINTAELLQNDQYYLVNFRVLKKNLYNSFDQQILVHTGYVHTDTIDLDSDSIYGGDAFNNQQYTFRANNTPKDETRVGVHKIFGLQSYDNLFMRKFGKEPWETYSPHVDESRLSAMYFAEDGEPLYTKVTESDYATKYVDNYFGYDEGQSSVNNIKFPGISSKDLKKEKIYSTRVVRSSDNFRIFKQDDFLDLSRKRGDLVKLTTYNNILIPHLQRSLVRTRGQEELQVDEITAFLGTGNIFGVKPEELIYTDDGFAGLLDKTHSMSTPYGYFFYDAFANRLYVLNNNGLKDITEPILPIIKDFNITNFFLPSPENLTYIEL